MNATINDARIAGFVTAERGADISAGQRLAQNNLLGELPGAVFGLITVAYLVASLLSLAR